MKSKPSNKDIPSTPNISAAEWEVMNLVWHQSRLTSAQIIEALSEFKDWKPKTVHTLIARLVEKGVLGFEEDARRVYYPLIAREQCVREESQSFVDRVFAGEALSAVLHFVKHSNLTKEQLDELKSTLQKKSK